MKKTLCFLTVFFLFSSISFAVIIEEDAYIEAMDKYNKKDYSAQRDADEGKNVCAGDDLAFFLYRAFLLYVSSQRDNEQTAGDSCEEEEAGEQRVKIEMGADHFFSRHEYQQHE